MKIFINEKLLEISEQKINVINESGSLGDALAWVPIVNEFAIQKKCKINLFTPFKELFDNKYPLINFFNYWGKDNIVNNSNEKIYSIGCFGSSNKPINLQRIASEILGIAYEEKRPKINYPHNFQNKFNKKYVCISTQSTCQCKYWNNENGWNKTVSYLIELGYDVICIDKNKVYGIEGHMNMIPSNCIDDTGDKPLEERINTILNCDFFIGLSSGLSWVAWACKKPVVMISGFTDIHNEFYTPYRVINKNVCNSCWNDPTIKFNQANWLWCPRNKNFECSKEIHFDMVKEKIDQCINDLKKNS